MKRLMTVTVALALVFSACGGVRKANEARKTVGDIKETAENLEKGTSGDKKLDAFLAKAEKAQKTAFTAEYSVKQKDADEDDEGSELRLVQDPPKGRIEIREATGGATIYVDDGEDLHICSESPDGEVNCTVQAGAGGQGQSLATFTAAFNPVALLGFLKAFVPLLGDLVEVRHFAKTLAGERLDCVEFSVKDDDDDKNPKVSSYCITDDGVFAYSDDGEKISELKDYEASADDDEFEPPKSTSRSTTTSSSSSTSTTSTTDPDDTTTTTEE